MADKHATVAQAIETMEKKYQIPMEGKTLVIAPTRTSAGDVVSSDQLVEGIAQVQTLEMWTTPSIVNVAVSNGSTLMESREVLVDVHLQLTYLVPLFQQIFVGVSKDLFVFRYLEADDSEASIREDRWLSATQPLLEQNFNPKAWLILYPVSALAYRPAELGPPLKEGFMFKQAMKKGKYSNKKKKWFVCKDFFLYYYKNKEESQVTRVLPLEYFFCRMLTTRDTETRKNHVSIFLKRSLLARTMKVGEEYVLTAVDPDNAKELREWFDVLSSVCLSSGDVRQFGVDLRDIAKRPNETTVPSIVVKCVTYLEQKALNTEGLFRISGAISFVEYYKDKFNQELDTDLSQCNDVHTVASLLKLFFRDLPDPLLTYEYYDAWIASHEENVPESERISRALDLVTVLPEQNKAILYYICAFLTKVSEHSEKNKMTIHNLAVVFGMNLLRAPMNETAQHPVALIVKNTPIINDLAMTLIREHKQFLSTPGFPAHLIPGLTQSSTRELLVSSTGDEGLVTPPLSPKSTPNRPRPAVPPRKNYGSMRITGASALEAMGILYCTDWLDT